MVSIKFSGILNRLELSVVWEIADSGPPHDGCRIRNIDVNPNVFFADSTAHIRATFPVSIFDLISSGGSCPDNTFT
jgi:hypothetical protein